MRSVRILGRHKVVPDILAVRDSVLLAVSSTLILTDETLVASRSEIRVAPE